MSKLDDAIEAAKKQMKAQKIPCNAELLEKVARGLGPALYKTDSKLIAARDAKEIATIKKNFISKKLGETDEAKQDKAIAHILRALQSLKAETFENTLTLLRRIQNYE